MRLFRANSASGQNVLSFIRFGIVGGSGVLVDMAMFFVLSDPRMLHLDVAIGKAIAAETAILNNFIWNDLWTFRRSSSEQDTWAARGARFLKFNLICLAGIAISIGLLKAQVRLLHVNMYPANLIAIFLVSVWNFGMSAKFGWGKRAAQPNDTPAPIEKVEPVIGALHH
jgi:dolichol-phosphate mannosyltransferase